MTIARIARTLLISSSLSIAALAGADPCNPDFGSKQFRFAGAVIPVGSRGGQPECPAEYYDVTVSPVPRSGAIPEQFACGTDQSWCWLTEPGDEEDYTITTNWQCEGQPPNSFSYPMTLVTWLEVVGVEATQGVQSANPAVSEVSLVPGRRTFVRVHVEYNMDDAERDRIKFTPHLRAFQIDVSQNPSCVGEFPGSPLRALNPKGVHVVKKQSRALARRGRWKASLNFELDGSWLQDQIQVRIESERGEPLFSWFGSERPEFGILQLVFDTSPPLEPDGTPGANLDVRLFAVPWQDATGGVHRPTPSALRNVQRRLRAMLPFPNLDYEYDLFGVTTVVPDAEDPEYPVFSARAELHHIAYVDYYLGNRDPELDPAPLYYGVLADFDAASTDVLGVGLDVAVGFETGRDYSVHAHEIAHVLGVEHAVHSSLDCQGCSADCLPGYAVGPCCSQAEVWVPDFPHIHPIDGMRRVATLGPMNEGRDPSTEVWGLNMYPPRGRPPSPRDPEKYFATMSYCGKSYGARGQWFSGESWERAWVELPFWDQDLPNDTGAAVQKRLYGGSIQSDIVKLARIYEVSSRVESFSAAQGVMMLRERDGSGAILREVPFDPGAAVREPGVSSDSYTFAVPLDRDPSVRRVEIVYQGDIVDAIDASANAPVVEVLFPNGGEVLPLGPVTFAWTYGDDDFDEVSFWIQLSVDAGATWSTLSFDWPDTSIEVDTSSLPAATSAMLRVVVSDGFWNAEDRSDGTFEIPDAAPEVEILSPPPSSIYSGEQLITFQADAYDSADGVLRGPAIEWSSDIDGTIATGALTGLRATQLSIGAHLIRVTATDSAGLTSIDELSLEVDDPSGVAAAAGPLCDLEIDMSTEPSSPRVRDPVSFVIPVYSLGPDAADGVTVDVTVPTVVSVVSASTTQGGCSWTIGSVHCDLGSLDVSGEATITVDAEGAAEGSGQITAIASAATRDSMLVDNEIVDNILVRSETDPDADDDLYAPADGDCDDADPMVNPEVAEGCNGVDDNCDGTVDEGGDALCFDSEGCTQETCGGGLGCAVTVGDGDGDTFVDENCGGTDCNDSDPNVWSAPVPVSDLTLSGATATHLEWSDQSGEAGPGTVYEVVSGEIDRTNGFLWGGECICADPQAFCDDLRPAPPLGNAWWYLTRSENTCGTGDFGSRERQDNVEACP